MQKDWEVSVIRAYNVKFSNNQQKYYIEKNYQGGMLYSVLKTTIVMVVMASLKVSVHSRHGATYFSHTNNTLPIL